ncbi:uncharacterized protein [Elaeis guineensis]|uniref:uncharacterized protein n=1 Tax=Elaeis guineensis var. tenera TaxID=51953 RepID=UPI003C6CD1A9
MPPALHLRPGLHRLPTDFPDPNSTGRRCLQRAWVTQRRSYANASSPLLSSSSLLQRSSHRSKCPLRYAVLGAGFAGLSVVWHLLKHGPKESPMRIDIYDEVGIGAGASGVSGGLLHPYSPKAKLLWGGAECWKECLELLAVAEKTMQAGTSNRIMQDSSCTSDGTMIWRRGILRPATSEKSMKILKENAQNCLEGCSLEVLDRNAAQCLIPDLCVPFNFAVYMPLAMNIHPKRYLEALFLACHHLADVESISSSEEREINLFKEPISSLHGLSEEYDAVIICLGAKVDMLPELSGKLPLRTCRGVVAELQLPANMGGEYGDKSPSILSDAWLAFQGPRRVFMGSTWEWRSKNYASSVSEEEASRAMEELFPKASAVYPALKKWTFVGARGGLRAMPPLTPHGSLPLLGCMDDVIETRGRCMYWVVGGLGSRGLLYHGLVGKLTAQAVISSDEKVLPLEFTSWKKMASKVTT